MASKEFNMKQIIVSNTDPEYIRIQGDLQRHGRRLTKLIKINNSTLVDKFESEAKFLKDSRPPDFKLNITTLYHGTTAPIDPICEEGLDERLSRQGRFGKGIYFSDNPLKCCTYAEYISKPYLLVCRVILGDAKVYALGTQDVQLTREPFKAVKDGKRVYYDSVRGQPIKEKPEETEFVIYDQRRAVIDYVAYYDPPPKAKSPTVSTQPVSTASLPYRQPKDNDSDGSGSPRSGRNSPASRDGSPNRSPNRLGRSSPVSFELEQGDVAVPRVNVSRKRTKIVVNSSLEPDQLAGKLEASQTVAAATATARSDIATSNATSPHIVALKNLMAMKDKLPKHELDELTSLYFQTYGVQGGPTTTRTFDQLCNTADADDPVADAMKMSIREFQEVTFCADVELCRQFLENASMDVNRAAEAYFDATQ